MGRAKKGFAHISLQKSQKTSKKRLTIGQKNAAKPLKKF